MKPVVRQVKYTVDDFHVLACATKDMVIHCDHRSHKSNSFSITEFSSTLQLEEVGKKIMKSCWSHKLPGDKDACTSNS